jgi:cytidylate kinase
VSPPLVTIGGPPGSGKTTAARSVARALGLEFHSAGQIFRAEAQRRGMDLGEFSKQAEQDPEVDRALDDRMLGLARPGRLLEGRITGALCRRRGISSIYVVVTATEEVRAARIAERDGLPRAAALRAMRVREQSERTRYLSYYGIDLDRESPDLTIDSSERSPDEVTTAIVEFVRAHGRKGSPHPVA